jgi:hypothetical protein
MSDPKEHAHELINRLPQLTAVVGLLEAMLDPVSRAIATAPGDDEPLTPEEEKALAESEEPLWGGKPNARRPRKAVPDPCSQRVAIPRVRDSLVSPAIRA